MSLPLDQVLELVTGGLVELCAVLLLLVVAARVRAHAAAAHRRERAQEPPGVVLGTVVDEPPVRG